MPTPAQNIIRDEHGLRRIEGDWFRRSLPENVFLDDMAYPDTAYSFTTFFSEKEKGFVLGYASGNYGHGIFSTGRLGRIVTGKYVVLQTTRILSNRAVTLHDHCMSSWGSVITDSWLDEASRPVAVRRKMLEDAAARPTRHLEFAAPRPVTLMENVWVGFDAVIMPGVTVGRGAVIGCKTVVTEDVPPYAVVVGNPGKIIRMLEPTDTK
jgi:acetyltransferase-like isoleucine patch superfamily enzyme